MIKLKAKSDQELYQEAIDSNISPEIAASIALGAIYDFCAYLTCLKKPITFSQKMNVPEAIEVLQNFFTERNIEDDEKQGVMVKNWQDLIHK